ncbi:MAG: tetratricopeptide repeat protein [Bacteroides sp.]|nr:tetratricopeptide repeat protein [Prevotella sp.]MCM1408291.1 tetratricopeptide repeat protein [Treponema brennaborense]MCM1470477.1 tetratricopeptide repeat protein [Bacteroides sp.]
MKSFPLNFFAFFLCAFSVLIFSCKENASLKKIAETNDAYELFSLGADFLENGEYAAAVKASKKAASFFENFGAYENGEDFYYDSLVQIGEANLRAGKTKKARAQFHKTLALAPQNENLILAIAAVYFRLNEISEARNFFEAEIKTYSENPEIIAELYYYYALCLSARNNFQDAFYAAQVSQENFLKSKKAVPSKLEKLLHDVSEKLRNNPPPLPSEKL